MKKLTGIFFLMITAVLAGCGREHVNVEREVFSKYYLTTLKLTQPADILRVVQTNERELLSHTESIVATYARTEDDLTLWFNIIGFDEEEMTANRKFAFAVEEKHRWYVVNRSHRLRFDSQIVVGSDVLEAAYANENEKRVAVLKSLVKKFNADRVELIFDSETLRSTAMLVNQALNSTMIELQKSPSLAATLDAPGGMEFNLMNIGPARVRMILEGDIASIKIKAGKSWTNDFEEQPDVKNM